MKIKKESNLSTAPSNVGTTECVKQRVPSIGRPCESLNQLVTQSMKMVVTAMKTRFTDIQSQITYMKEQFTDMKGRITYFQMPVTYLKGRITNIQMHFTGMKEPVTDIQMHITDMKERVTDIQAAFTIIRAYFNSFESKRLLLTSTCLLTTFNLFFDLFSRF